MVIKEGVFANDLQNYSIKVERKGRNNNMLYDVMIYNHAKNNANLNVTIADSGKMKISDDKKYMAITLYNGHTYTDETQHRPENDRQYPFRRESFKKEVINISMLDFEFNRTDEKLFRGGSRMMNINQLTNQGDSLFTDYKTKLFRFMTSMNYGSDINRQVAWLALPIDSLRKNPHLKADTIVDFDHLIASLNDVDKREVYQQAVNSARNNSQRISQQMDELYTWKRNIVNSYAMEWHRKFTLSFACLIFFFIGAPLGAIIRKGGLGMPVVVSILMFIIYYIFMIIGEKFAREDTWTMTEGMWFSSFIFLPLGIWLTYKAATDSGIMNMETYQIFFAKLFRLFKRKKNQES